MYAPDYLTFAPLYGCNLRCPHCAFPREWTERLEVSAAVDLLGQAGSLGIREISFTGGEPFLYPEFLLRVSEEATRLDLDFDKVATNGGWWREEGELKKVLRQLKDSGYSGGFGLSVDRYHQGVSQQKRAVFVVTCLDIFGQGSVSLTYTSPKPSQGMEEIEKLAGELSGRMEMDPSGDGSGRIIFGSHMIPFGHNRLVPVGRASGLCDPTSVDWFGDECCRGPGNVVYVNPRGDVKPCCGFAIELEAMTIGNIYEEGLAEIIERGRKHPFVGFVFEHGLSEVRRRLDLAGRNPLAEPTDNCCYFCYRVLEATCWPI